VSQHLQALRDKAVEYFTDKGLCEPASRNSQWCAGMSTAGEAKKMRAVFNFSAHGEQMAPPPGTLVPDIPEVLRRLRGKRFYFASDIQDMFWKFLVHPDDRDVLTFATSRMGPRHRLKRMGPGFLPALGHAQGSHG
jgi:hypothetical protein